MEEPQDYIGYADLIDDAMRGVVRNALRIVGRDGLQGDHHCYITFSTDYPGVDIPDFMMAQYPEEMTIVLQHQFWDMQVSEDKFSVELSFNHQRHKLTVPFAAINAYADPSIKFGLQFRRDLAAVEKEKALGKPPRKKDDGSAMGSLAGDSSAQVISLDTFRKKD